MNLPTPDPQRIMAHWRYLCEDIGVRLAGTAGEAKAAHYIEEQFRGLGLNFPRQEEFPCVSLREAESHVWVKEEDGAWREVESRLLAGVPGTPRGKAVEGETVWIELPEEAERLTRRALKNRIAVIFGPLATSPEMHQALLAGGPKAVIHVDERLPFPWPKNDGTYPFWREKYGLPTIVTIPFMEAWKWRKRAERLRVRIQARSVLEAATSQNVIADLPGLEPSLPSIVLSAHHDTQANNVGADDNASGVVALLELARILRQVGPPLRSLRFISFGTEEQLSVGSAAYVRKHADEMARIGLVINFDSVASVLGHFLLVYSGWPRLGKALEERFRRAGMPLQIDNLVVPFADHFPFSVYGAPAVFLHRYNTAGQGRWQHHSEHDNLDNVSPEVLARLVQAAAQCIFEFANMPRLPFRRGMRAAQRAAIRKLARDLFGLELKD